MLRLTEIKLPLDHPPDALPFAILTRLGIRADQLLSFTVFKRGLDARKKSQIQFIYTVDVATTQDAALLARLKSIDPHLAITPDTTYRFVAHAMMRPVCARL
jgi:uncharacterized FAD-dependent dehydrogenase